MITTITVAFVATAAIAAAAIQVREENEDKMLIDGAQVTTDKAEPIHVETEVLQSSTLTEYVTVTGTAEAAKDVTFSAEIPGRVEYLGPKLGGRVTKGRLLAKIDYRTLQARLMQATAGHDLAKKTFARLVELGSDLVTQQQLDEAESALKNARANLAIAQSDINKSRVTSNIRGVVSAKYVEEAEYVAPGTPLYRVVDNSTIYFEAHLPETQVSSVKPGSEALVQLNALGESRKGTVEAILPSAHPASKTFTARVRVANPDFKILQGMSAVVKIAAQVHEEMVVVPQDLVLEGKAGRSVFVIENGKAIQRQVSLGGREGDRVAIIEGVAPGEIIVTLGHRNLSDGQDVAIVP